MKEPDNGFRRKAYWLSGTLLLALASVVVHLQNPFHTSSLAATYIATLIAVPAILAVVLILTEQSDEKLHRYLKNTTLGVLLFGIVLPESLGFLIVVAPVAWFVAYLAAKDAGAQPSGTSPAVSGVSGTPTINNPTAAPPSSRDVEAERRRKKMALLCIVLSFTLVSLAGRMIYIKNMETTSLMFIGVPSLLAVLLVLSVNPRSAMGTVMTGITFVLLLSSILFGEGTICILMAAPIFYLFGAIITSVVQNTQKTGPTRMMLLAPLLFMSLEGTNARLSLSAEQSVSVRRVVAASAEQVARSLASPVQFRTQLPLYLRMGFPSPVSSSGAGLAVGSQRAIGFAGGEGKPGTLVMEIVQSQPQEVIFQRVSDSSKIAHWLQWEDAKVSWHQVDEAHTEVQWTLSYRRNLHPAWYFDPWERYATGLAAGYLIDNAAAPSEKP